MKIGGIIWERPKGGRLLRLAGYLAAGFFSVACSLEGRAPLAVGFLAACRPGQNALAALCGGILGSFAFLGFGSALRCCGILVLESAVLSAFRDTVWFQHPLFRPLTAVGATVAVELAYALQMGLSADSLLRLLACTALAGLLAHYCSLLLRQTAIPRRQAPRESREPEGLRERLKLSADALRSLCDTFSSGTAPKKEENPAVVFDRAAEVVCRGCALRDLCWNKEYIATFNAFNDATPAILERGRAESGDFAPYFASRCIHFPQLVSAISTEVTALLLRRQYRRQLEAERQRTRGQYAQLSELVAQAMAAPDQQAEEGNTLAWDVAMGSTPKEGKRVCGDSVTYFKSDGSTLCLLLSDGMGSGREARRESQLTLRLTEQFLRSGIEAGAALRTINAALNIRSDEQGSFTTIDLLTVDLTDYQAALYKYGAAPTYIKRQGTVRRITGSALPAGLQDAVSPTPETRFPLEENTFVLMVSDGVADSSDDKWLQDLLAGWQGDDPNVLVSLVLRECRQRRHGDDDCSALCLCLPPQNRGKRQARAV